MDYTVGTDIICVWAQSDGRGGGRQLWLYTPSVLPCVWHAQNWQKKKKKEKKGRGVFKWIIQILFTTILVQILPIFDRISA